MCEHVLTAEAEVDGEGGFNFSGLVVEQIGMIACVADGFERGALQHDGATDDACAFDGPGFRDDGMNDDRALHAAGSRNCRVLGMDRRNQIASENTFRNGDGAG